MSKMLYLPRKRKRERTAAIASPSVSNKRRAAKRLRRRSQTSSAGVRRDCSATSYQSGERECRYSRSEGSCGSGAGAVSRKAFPAASPSRRARGLNESGSPRSQEPAAGFPKSLQSAPEHDVRQNPAGLRDTCRLAR